jgi:serine/threonine-protein kinase
LEKKQLDTILLNEGEQFSTYMEMYPNGHREILKVIKPECLNDMIKYQKILKQFNLEKQILKSLDIDYIPKYIGGGKNYLKLSYIHGKTLKQMAKEREMGNHEKIYIMTNLFFITKALHDKNIIHCDIKPSNIVCGIDRKVYLIDFGSATMKGEKSIYIQATPGFSAPEIYKPNEKRTYQSDVYSIMAVAYWLKHRKIYKTDSDNDELNTIFIRGLNYRPKKRYANLDEILEVLRG